MTADSTELPNLTTEKAILAETFAEFAARGLLRYPRGNSSGKVYSLDRHASSIDERVDWLPASGEARLHSFAIFYQRYEPCRDVPYVVAHVELSEGIRLISTLIDCEISRVKVGMLLGAEFAPGNHLVFRGRKPD